MKIPIYKVDAFTDKVFGGNPAAVCALAEWLPADVMQNIAEENNLSETAFFVNEGDYFHIRWFTPEIEVDLCGHATLANGFVIFNYMDFAGDTIRFQSKSGELLVTRNNELLTLDFPSRPPVMTDIPDELVKGLGMKPEEVWKTRDYLVVFNHEKDILAIRPDFGFLKRLDCLGIIITAPGEDSDFVSRFFAPGAGINEDPVTGSAHTVLAPYWSQRLNKQQLHAYQLSKRGGELWCEMKDDRVLISGHAVSYMKGELLI